MRKRLILSIGWVWLVMVQPAAPVSTGAVSPPRTYKTGFAANIRIGIELYQALEPQYQRKIYAQPVALEPDAMPYVRSVEERHPDYPEPVRRVLLSAGFVDLMNNVAHAKAIDTFEKGYFKKYVIQLSQETGSSTLAELPRLSDPRFWTDHMMNQQRSYFHQMIGMVLAIELSHFYLDQHQKYANRLIDPQGNPLPINRLLTYREWQESVQKGVRNSLDIGYGIDGVKALYDVIDQMPMRPGWTEYFLPKKVKVRKLKRTLVRIEKDYFMGG